MKRGKFMWEKSYTYCINAYVAFTQAYVHSDRTFLLIFFVSLKIKLKALL